jgi:F0F1-type ATP synthase assembly protein I
VLATFGIALSNDYFYAATLETVSQPKVKSKHESIESVRAGVQFIVRIFNSAVKISQTVLGFGSMLLMDVILHGSPAFIIATSMVGALFVGSIVPYLIHLWTVRLRHGATR